MATHTRKVVSWVGNDIAIVEENHDARNNEAPVEAGARAAARYGRGSFFRPNRVESAARRFLIHCQSARRQLLHRGIIGAGCISRKRARADGGSSRKRAIAMANASDCSSCGQCPQASNRVRLT